MIAGIVVQLTHNGVMAPRGPYKPPFTDDEFGGSVDLIGDDQVFVFIRNASDTAQALVAA